MAGAHHPLAFGRFPRQRYYMCFVLPRIAPPADRRPEVACSAGPASTPSAGCSAGRRGRKRPAVFQPLPPNCRAGGRAAHEACRRAGRARQSWARACDSAESWRGRRGPSQRPARRPSARARCGCCLIVYGASTRCTGGRMGGAPTRRPSAIDPPCRLRPNGRAGAARPCRPRPRTQYSPPLPAAARVCAITPPRRGR